MTEQANSGSIPGMEWMPTQVSGPPAIPPPFHPNDSRLERLALHSDSLKTPVITSLTAVADRPEQPPRIWQVNGLKYTTAELTKLLNDKVYVVPHLERSWVDPVPPNGGRYALISFIPSSTAVPDENGIFGMLKVRGVFATTQERDEWEKTLVSDVDSFHPIYECASGMPLPIGTVDTMTKKSLKPRPDNAQASKDLDAKMRGIISDETRRVRDIEMKKQTDMDREMKKRRDDLLRTVERPLECKDEEEQLESFIRLSVKRANLIAGAIEHMHNLRTVKESLARVDDEFQKARKERPDLEESYLDKYTFELNAVGINPDESHLLDHMKNPIPFPMDDLDAYIPPLTELVDVDDNTVPLDADSINTLPDTLPDTLPKTFPDTLPDSEELPPILEEAPKKKKSRRVNRKKKKKLAK